MAERREEDGAGYIREAVPGILWILWQVVDARGTVAVAEEVCRSVTERRARLHVGDPVAGFHHRASRLVVFDRRRR